MARSLCSISFEQSVNYSAYQELWVEAERFRKPLLLTTNQIMLAQIIGQLKGMTAEGT